MSLKSIKNLLKESYGILYVDTLTYAEYIRSKYPTMFNPTPKGLYLPGRLDPSFTPDKTYYINKGDKIPFDKIKEYTGRIYQETIDSKHPYTSTYVREGKLTEEPTVPASQIKLAYATIVDYIDSGLSYLTERSPYARELYIENTRIFKEMYDIIAPEYHASIDDGSIYTIFDALAVRVGDFIGNDTWNLYTYKLEDLEVVVNKGPDLRIYEWTKMEHERLNQKRKEDIKRRAYEKFGVLIDEDDEDELSDYENYFYS